VLTLTSTAIDANRSLPQRAAVTVV
jgi:hypothetical protein